MRWKTIKEVSYIPYEVSDTGRVRNRTTNKELSPTYNKVTGYCQIRLMISPGKGKGFSIHRLVASAFVPNPNNYSEVNHINEVKTDNRASNLEWCSRKYNCNYGNHNNRISESQRKNKGSKRIPVIVIFPNGTHKYAHSLREASEITGWNRATIQRRLDNPKATFDKNTYKFIYASERRNNNKSIVKYNDDSLDRTKKELYDNIISRLKRVHPNLIITGGTQGMKGIAHFKCTICGYEFDKTPDEAIHQKYGCYMCANRKMGESRRKSRELAEEQIKEYLYNNLILGEDYVRSSEVCHFTCKRCGKEFTTKLTNLLANAKRHNYVSNGCQSCSKSRSVTITNLKKYGHSRDDIIKELHKKKLDWC